MTMTIRIFLIWMMVLAIPTQGFAASAMLHCGPNHSSQVRFEAMADHAQHGHVDQSEAHEDTASNVAGPSGTATDAQADHGSRSGGVTKLGKFKCSACAACCSAVAIPSSVPPVFIVEIVSDGASSSEITRPGFITDGPERPPRIALG